MFKKTQIIAVFIIFLFITASTSAYLPTNTVLANIDKNIDSNRDILDLKFSLDKEHDNLTRIHKNMLSEVTLISKSDGLDIPTKEEGKTEYEIADMNQDGYLDIISVGDHGSPNINSNQHGIMIWLGDGGNYWDVTQSGNFGYGGCAIGDLNLDGFKDVAWGVHHNYANEEFGDTLIDAALGDGTASNWTPWGEDLATNGEDWGMFATDLADFDIDGDLDIISQSFGCCNGIQIYENCLNGTWNPTWSYDGGNVQYTIETCDFNADGYPDFICSHQNVNAFYGDGNFSFTNSDSNLPTGSINAVDVGDVNNDGADDLAVALTNGMGVRCYVYNNQTNQWTSQSTGLPDTQNYYLIQCGDINGDQNIDIITYKEPTGTIYLGNGNGVWNQDASWTMPSPGDYSAMRVDGDVDFDGREDIVIQAEESDFPTNQNILRLYSPWEQPNQLSGYIKSPGGGETLIAGSIRKIKWLSSIPSSQGSADVTIKISEQGITGPWNTIVENIPNTGKYQWTVQGNQSNTCRIKIILSTNSNTYSMVSNDSFTIKANNDNNNFPPKADFTYSPSNPTTDDIISFIDNSSDSDGVLVNWTWSFGDGNHSFTQNPMHQYNNPGEYMVSLNVTDDDGGSDSFYQMVSVDNYGPNANFSFTPAFPQVNESVQFTDLSFDNSGDSIVSWNWSFGDGNYSTQENPIHNYSSNGSFTVDLMVCNSSNVSDSISKMVYVGMTGVELSLLKGWNLITVPVENDMWASDLAGNITSCLSVSRWNASMQTYKTYIVGGPPSFDFPLDEGHGYFVDTNQNSTLTLVGDNIFNVSVSLKIGWNLLGWYHDYNTTAISLSENITGCTSVSKWNATLQTYDTYIVGGPDSFDFKITRGMGLFVDVNQTSYWYGEG